MFKMMKISVLLILMIVAFQAGKLWQDKNYLQDNLIRLHVVADSDSEEDQTLKLQVKDAVVEYLTPYMEQFDSQEEALTFIGENLETIRKIGEDVVAMAGFDDAVEVSIAEEAFDTREYDTFSLPAGIYQSLRVQVGSGEGKNWWCVAFPSLCIPASSEEFTETAATFGMDGNLADTLRNDRGYELRFYFLERLGLLENLFAVK